MVLELEPEGILFTEIRFMNHRVERRAKLQRRRFSLFSLKIDYLELSEMIKLVTLTFNFTFVLEDGYGSLYCCNSTYRYRKSNDTGRMCRFVV